MNLALIGPMGAGKSTVGRMVAARLGRRFVDTDDVVVEISGSTIPEIFADGGEDAFRRWESKAVERVSVYEDAVIACGGGVPLSSENVDRLKRSSTIIYLRVDAATAFDRIGSAPERPLLGEDPRESLERLIAEREQIYDEASDLVIEAELSADEVAGVVCDLVTR